MEKKTLKSILHAVDPALTVVPGGRRPHKSTAQDFIAATGVACKKCGKEVQRIRDGYCLPCWEEIQDSKIEIRDKTGMFNSSLLGEGILAQIVRPYTYKK